MGTHFSIAQMTLQRHIIIIVRDAKFEPGTTVSAIWWASNEPQKKKLNTKFKLWAKANWALQTEFVLRRTEKNNLSRVTHYLSKQIILIGILYIILNNAWSYLFQCQSTGVSCLYTQTKANQSTCKTKINLFCYCFYNVTRFSTFQIQLANHAETKNNGQVVVKSLYFRKALPFHLKYLSKLKIICQHTFWKESAEQRAVTDVEWNVYKL